MSMRALVVSMTVVAGAAALGPPALADSGVGASSKSAGMPTSESNDRETRKIVGISLLGFGVVVAGVGAVMALEYNHSVGACDAQGVCSQEDGRVPLGLAMIGVGAFMAAASTILWAQVPKTSARLAVVPSGAMLSGTF